MKSFTRTFRPHPELEVSNDQTDPSLRVVETTRERSKREMGNSYKLQIIRTLTLMGGADHTYDLAYIPIIFVDSYAYGEYLILRQSNHKPKTYKSDSHDKDK